MNTPNTENSHKTSAGGPSKVPQEHMSQGSENLKAPKRPEGRWVGLSRELPREIEHPPPTLQYHTASRSIPSSFFFFAM